MILALYSNLWKQIYLGFSENKVWDLRTSEMIWADSGFIFLAKPPETNQVPPTGFCIIYNNAESLNMNLASEMLYFHTQIISAAWIFSPLTHFHLHSAGHARNSKALILHDERSHFRALNTGLPTTAVSERQVQWHKLKQKKLCKHWKHYSVVWRTHTVSHTPLDCPFPTSLELHKYERGNAWHVQ